MNNKDWYSIEQERDNAHDNPEEKRCMQIRVRCRVYSRGKKRAAKIGKDYKVIVLLGE